MHICVYSQQFPYTCGLHSGKSDIIMLPNSCVWYAHFSLWSGNAAHVYTKGIHYFCMDMWKLNAPLDLQPRALLLSITHMYTYIFALAKAKLYLASCLALKSSFQHNWTHNFKNFQIRLFPYIKLLIAHFNRWMFTMKLNQHLHPFLCVKLLHTHFNRHFAINRGSIRTCMHAYMHTYMCTYMAMVVEVVVTKSYWLLSHFSVSICIVRTMSQRCSHRFSGVQITTCVTVAKIEASENTESLQVQEALKPRRKNLERMGKEPRRTQ